MTRLETLSVSMDNEWGHLPYISTLRLYTTLCVAITHDVIHGKHHGRHVEDTKKVFGL